MSVKTLCMKVNLPARMVSLDRKGRMNIWENFEEVIDEDTFKNESRTHVYTQHLHNGI